MILLLSLLGALFGFWRARKRGGSRFDIAQYTAVHAILFGLIGLFAEILLLRLAG